MTIDPIDRQEILDLIAKYSYGYDTQDWELFASIWADDAVVESGTRTTRTAEAIIDSWRGTREAAAAAGRLPRHHTTNTLLSSVGEGRVTGRTTWFVHVWKAGEPAPFLANSGTYHDEFVRNADGWRIASRQIEIDQA